MFPHIIVIFWKNLKTSHIVFDNDISIIKLAGHVQATFVATNRHGWQQLHSGIIVQCARKKGNKSPSICQIFRKNGRSNWFNLSGNYELKKLENRTWLAAEIA